ncbi:hypothetical protein [Acidianus ambivalens]|uniref:Uncharacterized protein n=1 Tax=Acidianus ambivalens TaxID=2283 RepID=A0A650CV82_ACIAM|nr:hypothetical protein [Acidianus ambivalens]MQL55674.1 hypothetical protein [Acidianus ambivalens]QGR21746.1 hypothetical protein D1866_06855 [Acidianus ambivalens]
MEEEFTLLLPSFNAYDFFSNPSNIIKFIPLFKSISQISDNEFIVSIGWILNVKINVKRILAKNRISYIISRSEQPRITGKLDHIFEPLQGNTNLTKVKIIFYYKGPLEKLVKIESRRFYNKVKDEIDQHNKEEVSDIEFDNILNQMKTILSGIIKTDDEFDMLINKAVMESINSEIALIIGSDRNSMKFLFDKGNLIKEKGSVENIKSGMKFVMKKKE